MKKRSGLSSSFKVRCRYGTLSDSSAKGHTFRLNAAAKYGLSFEERELLVDEADGLETMPPGEEGMLTSNAGGIDEVYDDVLDQFLPKRRAPATCRSFLFFLTSHQL
jgi:hypothetical protein